MRKVLIALSDEVAERSSRENRSALVDALLAKHYSIDLPSGDPHLDRRHAILEELAGTYDVPEPDVSDRPIPEPLPTHGKPVDSVVPATQTLDATPNVPILVNNRPALQNDDGTFTYIEQTPEVKPAEEWCPVHNKDKIAGLCLDCL